MSVVPINHQGEFAIAHQRIVRSISYKTVAHELLLRRFKGKTTQHFIDHPNDYVTYLPELMQYTARVIQKLSFESNIVNVMINFTEKQMLCDSFFENLDAFYNLGLEAANISLDITCLERTFSDELMNMIVAVKKKGHPIVIGGFGGLPCDFEYIIRTRPAMVKLSRKMVENGRCDKHAVDILRNVVGFLKQSGTRVVIEGVETQEDLLVAGQCNADFMQGFFFDKANDVVSIGEEESGDYTSIVNEKLKSISSSITDV